MESSNQAKSILLTPTGIDRLTDRIKELEDALAEEIKLADALLADVRRLVDEAKLLIESAEDSHSHCDCYEVATLLKCSRDTEKAVAAVERHLAKSLPHSSHPPADTGRA